MPEEIHHISFKINGFYAVCLNESQANAIIVVELGKLHDYLFKLAFSKNSNI
jgi:hypothetical protein